jgi:serine protease Do
MLPRSSALFISLTSLSAGILLGIFLGRGGSAASAQATAPGGNAVQSGSTSKVQLQPSQIRLTSQSQSDDQTYDLLAKQYEQFRQVNRTFELVAKAVSPAVVHIVAEKMSRGDESRRSRKFEETGSGVIVRSAKMGGLYVLTNHHVVQGARPSKIRVHLRDGRTILPVKTWNDADADIAILKLDREDLPAARLGNSDEAPVGTWVLALGSPFGLMHSVSQGIVSARGRHMDELEDVKNQDFLQTDAAINPGNSGGPLVNMKGEVIGINNSIASNGGGNEGVGFSIPINLARWIMDELIVHGRVTRGALGVELHSDFGQDDAVALGMERPRGALIDKIHLGSPAAKAGLRDGDVVLRFGSVDITDVNHLINSVSMTPVGEVAEVIVWRDRREMRFVVTVGDRDRTLPPSTPGASPEVTRDESGLVRRPNRPEESSSFVLGLELTTLNSQLAERVELPETWRGALVLRVDPESPLSQFVKPRDIITSVDSQAIQSADQAVKILNQRAEHAPSVIGLDRLVRGQIERYTIRVP